MPLIRPLSSQFELVEMIGHHDNIGAGLVTRECAEELERDLAVRVTTDMSTKLSEEWDLPILIVRLHHRGLLEDEALANWLRDDDFVSTLLSTSLSYTKVLGGAASPQLPWQTLEHVFGVDAWSNAVQRPGVRKEPPIADLVAKYLSGWRPKDFGDED